MRISAKGNSIYFEVGVFRNMDGSIHMTSPELSNYHVAIRNDSTLATGHRQLYKRLDELLKRAAEIQNKKKKD